MNKVIIADELPESTFHLNVHKEIRIIFLIDEKKISQNRIEAISKNIVREQNECTLRCERTTRYGFSIFYTFRILSFSVHFSINWIAKTLFCN